MVFPTFSTRIDIIEKENYRIASNTWHPFPSMAPSRPNIIQDPLNHKIEMKASTKSRARKHPTHRELKHIPGLRAIAKGSCEIGCVTKTLNHVNTTRTLLRQSFSVLQFTCKIDQCSSLVLLESLAQKGNFMHVPLYQVPPTKTDRYANGIKLI